MYKNFPKCRIPNYNILSNNFTRRKALIMNNEYIYMYVYPRDNNCEHNLRSNFSESCVR